MIGINSENFHGQVAETSRNGEIARYSRSTDVQSGTLPQPGRGTKILIEVNLVGTVEKMKLMMDTGSSTSLVTTGVVRKHKLKSFNTKRPIKFKGLFGETEAIRNIAVLNLKIETEVIAVPVYIVDELPSGVDILMGMDQIGLSLGLDIPIANTKSVSFELSFKSGKRISGVTLTKASSGQVLASIEGPQIKLFDVLEHGNKHELNNSEMGVEGIKQGNTVGTEFVKNPVISKSSNRPRDELEQIAAIETNGAFVGLGEFGQSKEKSPETPRDEPKLDKFTELSKKLEPLHNEVRALNEGLRTIRGKLTKLQNEDLSDQKPAKKRVRNGQRQKQRVESIRLKEFKGEIEQFEEELIILQKMLNQVQNKIKRTTKMVKRMNRAEENKQFRAILPKLQRTSAEDLAEVTEGEEVSFVRIVASKEEKLDEDEIAEFTGDYESKETKVYHILSKDESDQLLDLIQSYSDVIIPRNETIPMGQANIDDEFDIELKEGAMERLTKKRVKPYPIKGEFKIMLDKTLEELEKVGVGVNNPPNFYAEIAAPTFFAKNRNKWRMVHDFKNLNDETRDMVYPIPLISTILESLKGSSFYTIMDLKSGYYQFKLSERARKLCAVISPKGIFQFGCLPMGLKNAPPFFQRIMDKILKLGLGIYVFVYIDDVIVFSSSFEEHLGHLNLVLEMMREANLKANIEKCNFCLSQIKVLGKVISREGIRTDPELVRSMVEFPEPTSAKKVKGFLAMLNFYREHIENFGPKTEPLAELARDDFKWDKNTWKSDPKYQQCFDGLKHLMLSAPILAYPDFGKDFNIQTDASNYGAGAVLYQYDNEDKRVVVSYASWLFNQAQRKYNTTERELLGIVKATRKWKPYLRRTHFTAETDHQPLEGYLNLNDPYGKIARWAAELTQFHFTVKYIKGITNIPPDTLSRIAEECALLEEIDVWSASRALANTFSNEELEVVCFGEVIEFINLNQLKYSWPSDEEFIEAYKSDKDLDPIYTYIKENRVPEASIVNGVKNDMVALEILRKAHLYLLGKDGKLYHYADKKNRPEKLVLCVPKKYIKLILEETHDSLWAGAHMGRDKTLDKIKEKYHFRDMKNIVSWYIKSCIPCQESKRKQPTQALPWGTIQSKGTWDLLCVDLWDSGVTSSRGNRYILTVLDGFSKFAHAIPIRN